MNGPRWSDGNGWYAPQYNSTIQLQTVVMGTESKLYLLARSAAGIHMNSYNPTTNKWEILAQGPAWRDTNGWWAPQYYSTIRTEVLNTENGQKIFLISRSSAGIHLNSYDPSTNKWSTLASGPTWTDGNGWGLEQYYRTIQSAVLPGTNNNDKLLLLARASDGIHLHSYDTANNKWQMESKGPAWRDVNGWYAPQYNSTIRSEIMRGKNGERKLFLLARCSAGINLLSYDFHTKVWETHPRGPVWTDNNGWGSAQYYGTIRTIVLRSGNGLEKLVIMARDSAGINASCYDPVQNIWEPLPRGPAWTDSCGWWAPQYNTTLQLKSLRNHDKYDRLLLTARSSSGIHFVCYDPQTKKWLELPSGPALTDTSGWGCQQYYSSIHVHTNLILNAKQTVLISARWAQGMAFYPYTINHKMLDELFSPQKIGPKMSAERELSPNRPSERKQIAEKITASQSLQGNIAFYDAYYKEILKELNTWEQECQKQREEISRLILAVEKACKEDIKRLDENIQECNRYEQKVNLQYNTFIDDVYRGRSQRLNEINDYLSKQRKECNRFSFESLRLSVNSNNQINFNLNNISMPVSAAMPVLQEMSVRSLNFSFRPPTMPASVGSANSIASLVSVAAPTLVASTYPVAPTATAAPLGVNGMVTASSKK